MKGFQKFIQCERRQWRKNASWLIAVLVLLFGYSAARGQGPGEYSELKARISAALSSSSGAVMGVMSVKPTEATELLEVTLDNGLVLYATEDGEHFVVGDLYAIRTAGLVNLAEEKREADRKVIIDRLDIDDMIVFPAEGEVRDYITVFTDTTCFYCQKLHREVDDLNAGGIEVRYLAYPRGGLDSEGARKLATAWCAPNPQETLTKLKSGVSMPLNDCSESPVAEQYQLGVSMGVRGTPAIITSSGKMIPGYKPAADLARILGLD